MPYKDPEKGREYRKQHYQKNKGKKLEYQKQYYLNNEDNIREYKKQYYLINREKLRSTNKRNHKRRYLRNREGILEHQRKYRLLNKEQILHSHRKYCTTLKGKITNKNYKHRRRVRCRFTDIDNEWLNKLFSITTHCELCNCELDNDGKAYPNGKQLDHITPLAVGGTHTKNNVRVICYKCNIERPKDGSDNLKLVIIEPDKSFEVFNKTVYNGKIY